jgi:hypothetical protein
MTLRSRDVKLIDVHDLEELIRSTYQRPYSVIYGGLAGSFGDGNHQETMLAVTVPAPPDLDELTHQEYYSDYERKNFVRPSFDEWRDQPEPEVTTYERTAAGELRPRRWDLEREYACALQPLLNDLHERGEIEAGEYVIHIWW